MVINVAEKLAASNVREDVGSTVALPVGSAVTHPVGSIVTHPRKPQAQKSASRKSRNLLKGVSAWCGTCFLMFRENLLPTASEYKGDGVANHARKPKTQHTAPWEMLISKWRRIIRAYRHRGADKSLAPPTSRCILFASENISFDTSLVIYKNSTNIHQIMIRNRIYENQNLLSL